jgi:type VI secretion system secreted protein VgrG
VSLRAHTDKLEILADSHVQVASVNGEITIQAKSRIALTGGDSQVLLDGQNITFTTPGSFTVKAASHAWQGAASSAAQVPNLPQGTVSEPPLELELQHRYDDLTPVRDAPYKVTFEDGTTRQGQLDANGHALLQGVPAGGYTVEYGEEATAWQAPPLPPDSAAYLQADVQAQGRARIAQRNPSGAQT